MPERRSPHLGAGRCLAILVVVLVAAGVASIAASTGIGSVSVPLDRGAPVMAEHLVPAAEGATPSTSRSSGWVGTARNELAHHDCGGRLRAEVCCESGHDVGVGEPDLVVRSRRRG